MLNLDTSIKGPMPEAAAKVKAFFGEHGLGLDLVNDSPGCLFFEGGGGFVNVNFCAEGHKTKLQFETREWEMQVKKFAQSL